VGIQDVAAKHFNDDDAGRNEKTKLSQYSMFSSTVPKLRSKDRDPGLVRVQPQWIHRRSIWVKCRLIFRALDGAPRLQSPAAGAD
jgi:hypothetical protein